MLLEPAFKLLWKNTDKADRKRIAGQTPPAGVTVHADLPYLDDGTWQHRLDVYLPEGTTAALPVLVDIHGGGWMYGTKEINKYYCMVLASLGYVVVNINYRLAPEAGVDHQLQDCMHAFRWVAENIAQFHGDLARVFLTGDSAGGFLAAFAALINTSPKLQAQFQTVAPALHFHAVGLTSPVCFLDTKSPTQVYFDYILGKAYAGSRYQGLVNLDVALPLGKMPPTVLLTSTGDLIARKQTWRAFEALKQNHTPATIGDWKRVDGKALPHVFSITNPFSPSGKEAIAFMLRFFQEHLA